MSAKSGNKCVVRWPLMYGLLFGGALTAMSGCIRTGGNPPIKSTFAVLEVTELPAMTPVVDARLTVFVRGTENSLALSEQPLISAPTDERGQVALPITYLAFGVDVFDGQLELLIEAQGLVETIRINFADVAQATGDSFFVKLLTIDSLVPVPPPIIEPVLGSNPALINIQGYAGTIWICANIEDLNVWQISAYQGTSYVDQLEIGDVPSGFQRDHPFGTSCRAKTPDQGDNEREAFSVFVSRDDLGSLLIRGYCIDATGTVVSCD